MLLATAPTSGQDSKLVTSPQMLDAQVQQIAAPDIVVAESVAKEQAAENDYRDDRGEAEQT